MINNWSNQENDWPTDKKPKLWNFLEQTITSFPVIDLPKRKITCHLSSPEKVRNWYLLWQDSHWQMKYRLNTKTHRKQWLCITYLRNVALNIEPVKSITFVPGPYISTQERCSVKDPFTKEWGELQWCFVSEMSITYR